MERLKRVWEKYILRIYRLGILCFKQRIKEVNLLVPLTMVRFSEPTALNVLQCQSFPVKQGATMISFYFGAIRICSNRQGELREVENLFDGNRYNHSADRDYMLHHKNDNNRGEAAVEFRWLSVKVS